MPGPYTANRPKVDPAAAHSWWSDFSSALLNDPDLHAAIFAPSKGTEWMGNDKAVSGVMDPLFGKDPGPVGQVARGALKSTIGAGLNLGDLALSPLTRGLPMVPRVARHLATSLLGEDAGRNVEQGVGGLLEYGGTPEFAGTLHGSGGIPGPEALRQGGRLAADDAVSAAVTDVGRIGGSPNVSIPGGAGPALPAGAYGARRASGRGSSGLRDTGILPEGGQGAAARFDEHLLNQPIVAPRQPPNAVRSRSGLATLGLRDMPEQAAIGAVRRGEHLIRDPRTGKYSGAPDWVDTPRKLQIMRQLFDDKVGAGIGGEDWYDRAKGYISELADGDPVKERVIAQNLGIMSAQANPDTNLGFSVTAHNAYEVLGQPAEKVRTTAQAAKANSTYDSMYPDPVQTDRPGIGHNRPPEDQRVDLPNSPADIEEGATGPKISRYAGKLDPTKAESIWSVNDIWHARGWHYTDPSTGGPWSSALTSQQHDFISAETLLAADRANARALGGRTDWNSGKIQAAPWVSMRAAVYFKNAGGDMRTMTPGTMTWEQAMTEASKTYPEYSKLYEGAASHPGGWTDPKTGKDLLYGPAGFLSRRTITGSQGDVARPLVGRGVGTAGPDTRIGNVLNAVEGFRTMMDASPKGGVTFSRKVGGPIKASMARGAVAPLDRPMTGEELARMQGGLLGQNGLNIEDTGGAGIRVTDPSGRLPGKKIAGLLSDSGDLPAGAGTPERAWVSGIQHDFSNPQAAVGWHAPGSITEHVLSLWDHPDVAAARKAVDASPALRAKVWDDLSRGANLMGRNAATDMRVQAARRAFYKDGFQGLRTALEKNRNALPSALLVALSGTLGAMAGRGSQGEQ